MYLITKQSDTCSQKVAGFYYELIEKDLYLK